MAKDGNGPRGPNIAADAFTATPEGLPLSADGRCIHVSECRGSLPSMLKRYDRLVRKDAFLGGSAADWLAWRESTRTTLSGLLGLDLLERCEPDARLLWHDTRELILWQA